MNWPKIIDLIIILNILVEFTECKIYKESCIGASENCYCDELCHLYGDCCYDSSEIPPNGTIASCIDGVYVIDKCYRNVTDQDLLRNCEDKKETNTTQLIFHVPVYGKYNSVPQVFKNAFCAMCNEKYSYEYAKFEVRGNGSKIYYEIPDKMKRSCYAEAVRTCLAKAQNTLKNMCYQAPTFYISIIDKDVRKVYRNAYCYFCNLNGFYNSLLKSKSSGNIVASLDFNAWCSNDCQTLLERFRTNLTSSKNRTLFVQCSGKYKLMGIIEKVIVMVFSIASIGSLFFMIFVYSCVEDHDNLAAKITTCVATSLLLFTFTSTIFNSMKKSQKTSIVCFYLSIVYHYSFLSSFAWMSIFAADVYHSLTSFQITRNGHSSIFTSKKFIVYCLVGYGVPLALTTTAFTIQVVDENNPLSAGFGERECFINRRTGGLVWLFSPLCICLVINILICGFLYRFVYVASHQTAIATNTIQARKRSFILCLKLSVLFGAVWLPGFLGVLLNNFVLKLVGGIFCSLQGLMFSLLLIFGVKIRQRTRQYLQNMTKSKSGSSNIIYKPNL